MGAFLVNFHARTSSIERVSESLKQIPVENAWVAGARGNWISFWEQIASSQETGRIQQIAEHVSQSLTSPVIAFLVHDSDILCYWLYDAGKLLDKYNSWPCYWSNDDTIDEESLAADCEILAKYCQPGTDSHKLETLLTQATRASIAAGNMRVFALAEDGLAQLATLLGLDEGVVLTDYNDFGRDVSPEELRATWAGSAEQPKQDSLVEGDSETTLRLAMPPSPLYDAAAEDDVVTIEELVADGADINEIHSLYTCTALAVAAGQGTPATIRTLVELGADLHKKGRGGPTPLRVAVQAGLVENIRTLVELGANVNEFDPQTGTLLHWALMCSTPEAIHVLLELGADRERKNAAGFTPLHSVQIQLEGLRKVRAMLGDKHVPAFDDQFRELEEAERILTEQPK